MSSGLEDGFRDAECVYRSGIYIYRYGGGMRGLKEVDARYEMKCFLQGCCMVVLQLVCNIFMRK